MKIAVSGSNGFIGNAIVTKLSEYFTIIPIPKGIDLESFFTENKVDVLIHCATVVTDKNSDILNNNILYSNDLLKYAMRDNIVFLNLDTTAYYYRNNPYSLSKKIFRDTLLGLYRERSINLLLELVYGSNENMQRFIPQQISNLLQHKSIDMTMGTQTRNIIHIDDVVEGIKSILLNIDNLLNIKHEIYVASEDSITIKHLMNILIQLTESDSTIHFGKIQYSDQENINTIVNNEFFITKIHKPEVDLVSGLKNIVEEIKKVY